jgi:hypothetical protein
MVEGLQDLVYVAQKQPVQSRAWLVDGLDADTGRGRAGAGPGEEQPYLLSWLWTVCI